MTNTAAASATTQTARAPSSPAAPVPPRAGLPAPRLRGFGQSILEDITIDYGPPELLGRVFLKAETQARLAGVTLSFAPVKTLAEVNRANRDSWKVLLPTFDVAYGGINDENAYCIVGRNDAGEVVATQGARFFSWTSTSFHEELESLRLLYGDPERMRGPDESCTVTAPSARSLRGRVVYSGGVWYRPDFRGKGLASCITRLSKGLAFTRWYSDVTLSLMTDDTVEGGTWRRTGYPNLEWDVTIRNCPLGNIRCAIIWMRMNELIADLEKYLATLSPEVDRIIHDRAA